MYEQISHFDRDPETLSVLQCCHDILYMFVAVYFTQDFEAFFVTYPF